MNQEEDALAPAIKPSGNMTTQDVGLPEDGKEKRLIGTYQIIRQMGEGGMGSVYLGIRADKEFKKHVAIKVIKKGMDSGAIVARFRRERQILASLDHPSIAKLLDGGTTEDGLPYFVMEYIQGKSVNEYCDNHKLTIRERLQIFCKICAAVQYAHQNLVVHRDLKPGNILVTPDGTVKLLDFGIAKLLNLDSFSEDLPPTATDVRIMTPDYASPEQARGDPITTSSDVYSLGIILYELLSGQRPFHFANQNPVDILRVISEQEAVKPSTAISKSLDLPTDRVSALRNATPEKLQKELRGDLDNIILMALRKEPQRRYASVEAFSDDINRYLKGHPVIARKGTWSYRAGKYVKRHKGAVAAVAGLFLLLTTFSVIVTFQNIKISRQSAEIAKQRDVAIKSEQKAQEVTNFLANLFEINDPAQSKGENLTARQLLDRGAEKLQKEFKDQPEVQAELMHRVGMIYKELGMYDQAEMLIRQALQTRKSLFGPAHVTVAQSTNDLAMVLKFKGKLNEAEKLYRESQAIFRKAYGNEHVEVATSLNNLAIVLGDEGRFDEAEKLSREALAMDRKLLGKMDPGVATDLNNLAMLLQQKGKLDEAEKLFREALAILHKEYGHEYPEVARDLNNLAIVLQKKGQFDEAEKLSREVLALDRKLLGNDHPYVSRDLGNLGVVLNIKGNVDEAEKLFRETLDRDRKQLGTEHPFVALDLWRLSQLVMNQGKLDEAESLQRGALAMHRKLLGNEHPSVAGDMNGLAMVLYEKGQMDEAEKLLREALALHRKLLGSEHTQVATNLSNLAIVLQQKGKQDEAEKLAREAVDLGQKLLGNEHPYVAAWLATLAEVRLSQGNIHDATAISEQALAFPKEKLAADSRYRARLEGTLGAILLSEKKYTESEPLLLDGYKVLAAQEKGLRSTERILQRIVNLYWAWGKPDKAAEYQKLTKRS
jgi:serine/threonine-protein kinase